MNMNEMEKDILLASLKILIIILISLIINILINYIISVLMRKPRKNAKATLTSLKIIRRIKSVIIVFFCVIACSFQIPGVTSISISVLSGAGILSLILGYAAQKTLSNFFVGWVLLLVILLKLGITLNV